METMTWPCQTNPVPADIQTSGIIWLFEAEFIDVGKTMINHPPIHIFYEWYDVVCLPFPVRRVVYDIVLCFTT
jgi:hypothetical protein